MEKLKKYLVEAKSKGWTLDCYTLSMQYGVPMNEVLKLVDKIYSLNH